MELMKRSVVVHQGAILLGPNTPGKLSPPYTRMGIIPGMAAPEGTRMGHAGAIIAGGRDTAAEKAAALVRGR